MCRGSRSRVENESRMVNRRRVYRKAEYTFFYQTNIFDKKIRDAGYQVLVMMMRELSYFVEYI
jgi:hypothetical protein